MAGISSYVTIRDDAGPRSLSVNERDFIRSCALSSATIRGDGRTGTDLRKVRLRLGRWDNGAECTVQWGSGTRVTSLCTAELIPPSPDRPSEGMVSVSVDLSPMASTAFRQAPAVSTTPFLQQRTPNFANEHQRLLSNRIVRCLERIILIGGALDTEALCFAPGKWVWRLDLALTVLDDGGNLVDACVMAGVAALRHYRKPQVKGSDGDLEREGDTSSSSLPTLIPAVEKEPTPLPLHHTPLSVSFALIPDDDTALTGTSDVAMLIDPTDREELVQFGSLTIAMNVHSEVCLLDFGGGCELTPDKLRESWKLAESCVKSLCSMLETSLEEADQQAQRDRLNRLLQQQQPGLPLPPKPKMEDVPFFQEADAREGDTFMDVEETIVGEENKEVAQAQAEAEEAYRRQALDYKQGHFATAVREDNDNPKNFFEKQAGSLLASLLKSVQGDDEAASKPEAVNFAELEEKSTAEEKASPTRGNQDPAPTTPLDTDAVKAPPSKPKAPAEAMDIDSDEEDITILKSEFQQVENIKSKDESNVKAKKTVEVPSQSDDQEVDDLAMAIKKKKKKKSKSKK